MRGCTKASGMCGWCATAIRANRWSARSTSGSAPGTATREAATGRRDDVQSLPAALGRGSQAALHGIRLPGGRVSSLVDFFEPLLPANRHARARSLDRTGLPDECAWCDLRPALAERGDAAVVLGHGYVVRADGGGQSVSRARVSAARRMTGTALRKVESGVMKPVSGSPR